MTESNGDAGTGKGGRQTIMLVDGFGLIFRAFFAIQNPMSTAAGEQTNATYGFASMLLNVLNNEKPDYAIIALEGGKTFRHEQFEGYKANRATMPEELEPQVDRIMELVDAFNIPRISRQGYEADDVIGSLARHCAHDLGLEVVILTGDSDLLQLVEDHVEVVLPGARRFDEVRRYREPEVIERFGFGPELIPDYKGLCGDTSDNIPGVPGIGDKTATSLIQQFGTVEEMLARLPEVTPTRARNALEANPEAATTSKHLATVVRDLDIELDLDKASIQNYDRDAVVELFRELQFRSLLARLPENSAPIQQVRTERAKSSKTCVTTEGQLSSLVQRIRETGAFAIDVETTSLDAVSATLVGIAIAVGPSESYYIPVGHIGVTQIALDRVREALDPVLVDPDLVACAHHAKYDLMVLIQHGFTWSNLRFDTMIAAYLLGETSVGLKDLAFTKLGMEMTEITKLIGSGKGQLTMDSVSLDQVTEYACDDVEATFGLRDQFAPMIEANNLTHVFNDIEMPLIPVLADMELTGVAIDVPYLQSLSSEIEANLRATEAEIYRLVGHDFNINSTKQLATVLFEELKLPSGKKTKTGYSVDQDVLEAIAGEHDAVRLILDYRSLGKLLSTYVDALPRQVNPKTGRVHTSFNQTIAATGRLSSTNPNLQNIPIRTALGRRVRHAFIADQREEFRIFDDAILLSADYSQIELRLMAHFSQEPFLVEAFRNGEDIHAATAALVNDVPRDEVTADQRRIAKTVNFGILYGMQAFGLSRDTGMTRAEASEFIQQYWSRLPMVKRYLDSTLEFGREHGYVQTPSGRRRLMPDLQSSNGQRRAGAERMATNMPLQGTAADIMKIAMINFEEALKGSQLRARVILQVHDELVLELAKPDLDETAALLVQTMENAADLTVPLETETKVGLNWEEMTPLERTA